MARIGLSTRSTVVAVLIAAGVIVAVGSAFQNSGSGSGGSSGSSVGVLAAKACLDAVDPTKQYIAGTRSLSSLLGALSHAEGEARDVAATDAKYTPIATWIVQLEDQLRTGQRPSAYSNLAGECG